MTEPPPAPPPGAADPTVPLPVEPVPPGPPPVPPPGPPLEEPPPSRAIWPWLLLLLVLVLLGLGLLILLTHRDHNKSAAPTTKPVPSVVGLTKAAASARLTQLGFTVQVRLTPSAKPKDLVIAQAPQAGATLSRGGVVALNVSNGPPKAGVPNVVGLKVATAIAKLRAAHLDSQQKIVFARAAPGTVVKQTPAAGAEVKKGAPVLLEVSKGPQRISVPAVVGSKRDDAVATLKKAGLVAAVFSVPSTEPQGVVVAQHPAASSNAPKGSRVRLNVSQGPPATTPAATGTETTPTTGATSTASTPASATMPNLVGQKQLAAQQKLQSLGLRVRTVYVPSTKPRGTVVAQRPGPGTTVNRGTRVRINVSNGPNPQPAKAVPDVTGEDQATATSDLQAAGFQVQVVDEPTADPNQDGIVIDEDPLPGTPIPAGSQVTIYVGRAG
jgi:eukaryotic-like serine/threonine-protein kinase